MKLDIVDEGIVWKNPHPSIRARVALKGNSLDLGRGSILHSLQLGQARQSVDSRCLMLRSDDFGKNWSPIKPLIPEHDLDPRFGYAKAGLSRTKDGTLWAASMRFEQVMPEDSRFTSQNGGWVNSDNFICSSQDVGETWSKPIAVRLEAPLGGFPVISSPVHELASGELMLVFEPFFTENLQGMTHEVTLVYSSDGGRTWSEGNVIAHDREGRLVYFDPRLARLVDGRWVCFYWTHDRIKDESLNMSIAYSDNGHAWTEPAGTPLWGFLTLPLVLDDSRLLAVYNHRRLPAGIRCALSEDGGQTWRMDSEFTLWDQSARRITGKKVSVSRDRKYEKSSMDEMWTWDFGTPHPVLLDDGTILVTFYATQLDHIMHVRYVRFTIE